MDPILPPLALPPFRCVGPAYEASRLARSNADWYALLDLAAVVGTLIADPDGIYDPRSYNDRLLLGLRGMLSEAELHLLQLRMEAGRMRQIERGVYRQHLPTGLVRLPDGRVTKDPDLQVQRTIELIFARFAQLGSCQKVLRSLRDEGILLPRRQTGGPEAGELRWKPPAEVVIYEIMHNPAYAGAFVYGRHGCNLTHSLAAMATLCFHCLMVSEGGLVMSASPGRAAPLSVPQLPQDHGRTPAD